jgi:hypothetical protein
VSEEQRSFERGREPDARIAELEAKVEDKSKKWLRAISRAHIAEAQLAARTTVQPGDYSQEQVDRACMAMPSRARVHYGPGRTQSIYDAAEKLDEMFAENEAAARADERRQVLEELHDALRDVGVTGTRRSDVIARLGKGLAAGRLVMNCTLDQFVAGLREAAQRLPEALHTEDGDLREEYISQLTWMLEQAANLLAEKRNGE